MGDLFGKGMAFVWMEIRGDSAQGLGRRGRGGREGGGGPFRMTGSCSQVSSGGAEAGLGRLKRLRLPGNSEG